MTTTQPIRIISPVCEARFPNLASVERIGPDAGNFSLTLVVAPESVEVIRDAISKAGGTEKALREEDGVFKLKAKSTLPIRAVNVLKKSVPLESIKVGTEVRAQLGFIPQPRSKGGITVQLGDVQVMDVGNC